MTTPVEIDSSRIDRFERALLESSTTRVHATGLWRALATAFPHRAPGPAERRLLLDVLRSLEARGTLRIPSEQSQRWDRSMDPAVPTSVDLASKEDTASPFSWQTFPWHPHLHWVAQCRNLTEHQAEFLQRVHDGLVNSAFQEPAPMKYRSLQLTGHEKLLASLVKTQLFRESRLTLDLLGCLPETLPLAWEAIGNGGRMVMFENAGPFSVARRVLGEIRDRPYDLIAYGGGRSVLAALGHLLTIERRIETIHYVGDLDPDGLDIALGVHCTGPCWPRRATSALLPAGRQAGARPMTVGTECSWQCHVRSETKSPASSGTATAFLKKCSGRMSCVLHGTVGNRSTTPSSD
jgi:hypothetical protein